MVQKLTPTSSLLYRYFYRRVKASNLVSTINEEQIPLLSQPTLVSGFGLTYARDRRDDPADAKHGTFNTIDVSDAIEAIGSSASFFRGLFPEFVVLFVRPRIRVRAVGAIRRRGAVRQYDRRQHGPFNPGAVHGAAAAVQSSRNSAAGAVFRRRRHVTARLRTESGGTARPLHRISRSAGWRCWYSIRSCDFR